MLRPLDARDPRELARAHPRRPAFESTVRVDATRFYLNTGDDLLEAETIMQDVVQRRRRVFGPAHPDTLRVEDWLPGVRENLADA